MTKRMTIVGILLLIISTFSHAKSLQDIEQLLASQHLVRGNFEQLRNLEMFSAPLQSSGNFMIHKKSGLLWQQTAPFPVVLVLTKNKLSQKIAGQPAQIMTAQQNPMAFYFSHIFLSLFDGDKEQIGQQFNQDITEINENWILTLTPKLAPLDAVFSTITILGSQYIDQIELTEIRGDKTTIIFSNQSEQPRSLTLDESTLFDF